MKLKSLLNSAHTKQMDLSLERIKLAAKRESLTKFCCPKVIIGGSNGKGSCLNVLENYYLSLGKRVAVYTSPYLFTPTEQIRINGKVVTREQLIEALLFIHQLRKDIALTEFELMTLAALYLFKQTKPDILLLEVGLGGQDDAINIIDADIAIITNVSLEHCQWLGNTREAIAQVKAGIMRRNQIVIYGEKDVPKPIIDKAQKLHCKLFKLGQDFIYKPNNQAWEWQSKQYCFQHLPQPNLVLESCAAALMAITANPFFSVSKIAMRQALQKAHVLGRWQQLTFPKLQLLDVAHNPASMIKLSEKLIASFNGKKIHLVFSLFNDKPVKETINPLLPLIDTWYIAELNHPRATKLSKIKNTLRQHVPTTKIKACTSIKQAYYQAIRSSQKNSVVIVTGSFQTVAEAILALTPRTINGLALP